jgi:pseudouridine-5'-phosphate glycosidase
MSKIVISKTVQAALEAKQPVVALESTVISHGLPYPFNVETARAMEASVREGGALPATIAILGGVVHVGLDDDQLEHLAQPDGGVVKVSLWNLPATIARGQDGGTTVATTAHLAHQAGIEVFATGGIGGVHFDPFDESADLPALSRTPIVVVCAGPKSILNLPATLERLETLGVPVAAYRSDTFPAFHSPTSPYAAPSRLDSPQQVAAAHRAARDFGLNSAILLVNPISQGLPFEVVQEWVETANREARQQGVQGKVLTPFLLRRLSQLSNGQSDAVNRVLLLENARLAGEVAAAISARAEA